MTEKQETIAYATAPKTPSAAWTILKWAAIGILVSTFLPIWTFQDFSPTGAVRIF